MSIPSGDNFHELFGLFRIKFLYFSGDIYIYILFVLNAFCSQPQNDGLSLIVTAKMFLGVF